MVMLGSVAHARAPTDIYHFDEFRPTMPGRHATQRYTLSKLADLHYTRALAEREAGKVKIVPGYPGMVDTNLHHASTRLFLRPFFYAAIALFATPVEKEALSRIFNAGELEGHVETLA
ncbi:hypothetical protein C7999DRAFT_35518 [Corynascus novoguineensis]|uniref:Uncharacterized protein n=1 Tax=Corynascus novoguineensis TaxID=1126955 RepID=A0AAN7HJA2_9PEZI|nr:hypothetical protein C7999DRAFT_35518 [Corynascus novoguineensis]